MKKYKLEVNRDQLQVIKRALEFYARIGMGQLKEIDSWEFNFRDLDGGEQQYVDDALQRVGCFLTGLQPHAYRGISNREVPDTCNSAWDIHQVIRHHIAWEDNPEGGIFVQFDKPFKTSKQPLAKVETCDDEDA